MRVEFNQGVPDDAVKWLRENVGPGKIRYDDDRDSPDQCAYGWYYQRISKLGEPQGLTQEIYHVPTITVKDPELALIFALKWS